MTVECRVQIYWLKFQFRVRKLGSGGHADIEVNITEVLIHDLGVYFNIKFLFFSLWGHFEIVIL